MNTEQFIRESETSSCRVATMVFLSNSLPTSLLGEQVAQSLCVETGASVVLVRLKQPGNTIMTTGQQPKDLILNGSLRLPSQLPQTDAGFHFLNLGVNGELNSPGWITSLLEQLRRRFRYVLIEAVADELLTPSLFDFLMRSDFGYLFVQPASENIYQLDLFIRELRPRLDDSSVQIKPVLCLDEGEAVDGYDALIQNIASPVHTFIRGCPKRADADACPTGSFHADIRRLAREIGSCLVGLALSSGAAKGLSHIGVIQVLEENQIDVDVIAGSSIGAYIGAVWSFGHDGQALEKIAREMESPWALLSLIDPVFPPRQGFVRGVGVKKRLMKSIGHVRFAELVRPLRVMATNLQTLDRVIFSSGEVATAVHASVAVPGICVPVAIDGETYIDGGIVDPLPVDVLREMGVSRIIAVNAIPTSDRIRYCLQAERELAQLSKKQKRAREIVRKLIPLDEHLNYFARGNILEILMRSIHGAQIRMAEALGRQADIVLRPQICDDRWLDFRDPGRFIKPGREIAQRHLEEIKALVSRKSAENETALKSMAAIA
jgi:NTE family protein